MMTLLSHIEAQLHAVDESTLSLLAAERFPQHGPLIVTTVVTSTILFELFGPFWVKRLVAKSESP